MATTLVEQDFPATLCYASVLHNALVATPGITTPIDSVQYLRDSDTTRITWSTAPSSGEQTAAAATVAAHVPVATTYFLRASAILLPGEIAIPTLLGTWQLLGGAITRADFFGPLPNLFGRVVMQYRAAGGTVNFRLVEDKPGVGEVVISADPKVLPDTGGVWTLARFDSIVQMRPGTNVYRFETQLGTALSADVRFASMSLLEAVSKRA